MNEPGLDEQELAEQRNLGRHSEVDTIISHSLNPKLTAECWENGDLRDL